MKKSPIILFVYNRPHHTKKTVEALQKNQLAKESDLFIFSDGPRIKNDETVIEVRKFIKTIVGFKSVTIIEREENLGLCRSVTAAVSEMFEKYDAVIVLEDDIVAVPGFLTYMNQSLERYRNDSAVWSIAAHSPDVAVPVHYSYDNYAAPRFSCWGWGTWRDRWEQVDWEYDRYEDVLADEHAKQRFARGGEDRKYVLDLMRAGRVESWAAVFDFFHFLNDAVCMHPVKPLVRNIGLDGSGTNCGKDDKKSEVNMKKAAFKLMETVIENKLISVSFVKEKKLSWKSLIKNILRNIGVL